MQYLLETGRRAEYATSDVLYALAHDRPVTLRHRPLATDSEWGVRSVRGTAAGREPIDPASDEEARLWNAVLHSAARSRSPPEHETRMDGVDIVGWADASAAFRVLVQGWRPEGLGDGAVGVLLDGGRFAVAGAPTESDGRLLAALAAEVARPFAMPLYFDSTSARWSVSPPDGRWSEALLTVRRMLLQLESDEQSAAFEPVASELFGVRQVSMSLFIEPMGEEAGCVWIGVATATPVRPWMVVLDPHDPTTPLGAVPREEFLRIVGSAAYVTPHYRPYVVNEHPYDDQTLAALLSVMRPVSAFIRLPRLETDRH